MREPDRQLFQPAEAAGRFCQHLLPSRGGLRGTRITFRQVATERAQVVEFAKLHAIPPLVLASQSIPGARHHE